MMKRSLLFIFFMSSIFAFGQGGIELTFSGQHNGSVVVPDSVLIENLTKGLETKIYSSDLSVTLEVPTQIANVNSNQKSAGFSLKPNFPNPFADFTNFELEISSGQSMVISVFSLSGEKVFEDQFFLSKGVHQFKFTAGNDNIYFLKVTGEEGFETIKMMALSGKNYQPELELLASNPLENRLKSSSATLSYSNGDILRMTGYATTCNRPDQDVLEDSPEAGRDYQFLFENDVPQISNSMSGQTQVCQGTLDVAYEVELLDDVYYLWDYSGLGASISGQGTNIVNVDFSENATSGTLSLIPSNSCGDGNVIQLEITVNQLPNIVIDASALEIFNGESVTLTASGGDFYDWSPGSSTDAVLVASPSETTNFVVTASSQYGCSAEESITISVKNHPVSVDDNAEIDEDGSVLVDVLANDTDIDGDVLSITGFAQGTNGTVSQEGNALRYTPDADFNGSDDFTYDIGDGNGGIATGTVNVTINAINDLPQAVTDAAEIDEDGTFLIDVLANDTDIDGDILSITGFSQGSNGTVSQEGDALRYTPDADFNGSDDFTYDIEDGKGGISTGIVNVTINSVNDMPQAMTDAVEIDEDGTVLIDVLLNDTDIDGDLLSVTSFSHGSNGTVSQEGDALRYTPDADFNGSDSFTYDIGDGKGGIATGTVNVTINAINDVPQAVTDAAEINEDGTVLIDVLLNDTDIDGDLLSVTSFSHGSNGTVSQEGDALRYTPDADFNGSDSFTYDISDGKGGIATGTVNVTINAINDVPQAITDAGSVDEDGTILINVLLNDTDIDGDVLSITGFTQGTNGTVSQEGNALRYTPDAGFSGSDSFTYDISDGNGGVATGTCNVTIVDNSLVSMDITEPSGITDPIWFTVTASGNYEIVSSFYLVACDTVVYLYDENGTQIAANDDYVDLYGAIMDEALAPGDYYVIVENFDGVALNCHLEVNPL